MTHAPDARLLSSSTLINAKVCNPQGERLGDTREMLIVMMTGRIHYIVLETTGAGESGGTESPCRLLVPWAAFKWNEERGCLVLDVTAERLAAAPPFDPRSTADWEDAQWHQQVERYYGIGPQWEKPQNYTG
jgi:hypothetical protein